MHAGLDSSWQHLDAACSGVSPLSTKAQSAACEGGISIYKVGEPDVFTAADRRLFGESSPCCFIHNGVLHLFCEACASLDLQTSSQGPGLESWGLCAQEASNPKEDAAYFESLSVFVSKVRGEHFSWEQARDMTFKDIAKNVEMYHAMLSRLFKQGAEDPDSAAHAELVELLALKVCVYALNLKPSCHKLIHS